MSRCLEPQHRAVARLVPRADPCLGSGGCAQRWAEHNAVLCRLLCGSLLCCPHGHARCNAALQDEVPPPSLPPAILLPQQRANPAEQITSRARPKFPKLLVGHKAAPSRALWAPTFHLPQITQHSPGGAALPSPQKQHRNGWWVLAAGPPHIELIAAGEGGSGLPGAALPQISSRPRGP